MGVGPSWPRGPGCSGPGREAQGAGRAGGENTIGSREERCREGGEVLAGLKDTRGVLSPAEEVLFRRVLFAAWCLSYEELKTKRGDMAWAEDFQNERQEAIEHVSDKITSR